MEAKALLSEAAELRKKWRSKNKINPKEVGIDSENAVEGLKMAKLCSIVNNLLYCVEDSTDHLSLPAAPPAVSLFLSIS